MNKQSYPQQIRQPVVDYKITKHGTRRNESSSLRSKESGTFAKKKKTILVKVGSQSDLQSSDGGTETVKQILEISELITKGRTYRSRDSLEFVNRELQTKDISRNQTQQGFKIKESELPEASNLFGATKLYELDSSKVSKTHARRSSGCIHGGP